MEVAAPYLETSVSKLGEEKRSEVVRFHLALPRAKA